MSDDDKTVKDLIIQGLNKVDNKVEKVADKCEAIEKTQAVMTEIQATQANKIVEIHAEHAKMNVTLDENTHSLKEHMQQTKILKDLTLGINARLEPIEQDRLKKKAVNEFIKGKTIRWAKILGVVATLVGIATGLSRLL